MAAFTAISLLTNRHSLADVILGLVPRICLRLLST